MQCGNAEDRAQWNASLEKDLVDLLREHDTPEHKGQNGWSSEAWNTIVKKFHQKNPYARYEKKKIQEKEKELKREYKMIKEIRKQSGVSWDDQQCKILAAPPLWKNIIISHPKAGKFKTKAFPLFEALGELHDGQTAEGTYNFTSIEFAQPNHNSRILEELARIKEKHQLMVRILEEKGCRLMKMLRRCMCKKTLLWSPSKLNQIWLLYPQEMEKRKNQRDGGGRMVMWLQ
ncbi:uncharacterized protein LOC119279483 [Triticum dicoccoides]|uniref:uncharacterized protein LOC119279483 n=1 Tax=Triticum dicoccoides TaxID=85692 RepID=UPI00188E7C0A|nr:uncharacterized protein LOC119279483 [Triticum dicoccoides]